MLDNEPTMEDLMDEFNIQLPQDTSEQAPLVEIVLGDTPGAAPVVEADKAPDIIPDSNEPPKAVEEDKNPEPDKLKAQGLNSVFKDIALKYIEKGKWSEELAIEDSEGNIVLVKDLAEIDEDTFFQIEQGIKEAEDTDNKSKNISVEGLDDRRKNIIDIIREGGNIKEIFKSDEELNQYLNPFNGLDLDSEEVQERIYYNALVKYNKLDGDAAQAVVDKAKKDLTLDDKVKSFVETYNSNMEAYVEKKKVALIETRAEEVKKNTEFKKALALEYKKFDIKDTLSKKLTSLASLQKDGDFEIDEVYSKKMEDPAEAAELVLFLTDKEMYLKHKLSAGINREHLKVRQTIKIVPKDNISNKNTVNQSADDVNEFVVSV